MSWNANGPCSAVLLVAALAVLATIEYDCSYIKYQAQKLVDPWNSTHNYEDEDVIYVDHKLFECHHTFGCAVRSVGDQLLAILAR